MRISYRALGSNGRLGNQLFQIAGTLGRAYRSGDIENAVFPHWHYQPYFSIPERYFGTLNQITDTIDGGLAYMQDLREFSVCANDIHQFFAPSELAIKEAHSIHPHFDVHPHTTAVHVRRGDYLALPSLVTVCPIHYFTKAMNEMRAEHPGTHFLVFSDDPDWCIQQFVSRDDVTVIVAPATATLLQRDMADFTLMRSCDASIISNSTYSWWTAYLSRSQDVICPSRWLNGVAAIQIEIEHLLPDHWTRRSIDPIGPMRTPTLLVSEGDDGYIVTDPTSRQVHHLNATATLLFELCTGSNTVDDIGEIMQLVFPDDSWTNGLESLLTRGIVTAAP